MGVSDNFAMPVLLFTVVYGLFVMVMMYSIGNTMLLYDNPNQFELSDSLSNHPLTIVIDLIKSLSIGFSELGYWNIVLFAPFIIGISYIVLALTTPAWV